MVRVAINGYGRIGRVAHRIILERFSSEIEVVAINAGASTDITGWMYLLKYDSVYGPLQNHTLSVIANKRTEQSEGARLLDKGLVKQSPEIASSSPEATPRNDIGSLIIDGKEIPVYSQKDPSLLPWGKIGVDVVLECTGSLTKIEKVQPHIASGAKAVVLSSPAKGDGIGTYVLSINETEYKGENIISNASCTTNCIAPVAKIIETNLGIEKAMMTTIHAYTSDQRLHDGGHKDYRRARAAAQNIVPTSTGATKAVEKAMPTLAGKFTGVAFRVPVIVGSLSDFTFVVKKETTVEQLNALFEQEAQKDEYKNILEVTREPLVSSDIVGNPHSSIVDLSLTQVVGGNMVKVVAWYDNEWGYCNRLLEEAIMVGKKVTSS